MSKRTYTDTERLGLMFLALRDGVSAVEEREGVPDSTIYQWFDDAGGIGNLRKWLEAQTEADYLRTLRSFYQEAISRMKKLSDAQVVTTIHKLIGTRMERVSPVSISMSQQQAQVQGGDSGAVSAAEQAYISALRGQPSVEGGEDGAVPALPLPRDAPGGSEPPADSR